MKEFSRDNMGEINNYLNDLFVYYEEDDFFINNLKFFMNLADEFIDAFEDIPDVNIDKFLPELPFYSVEERLEIVRKYLTKYGFKGDLDDLISKGQVNANNNNYITDIGKKHNYRPYIDGLSASYPNGVPYILVPNTGYIFDSLIMAHELSHMRNHDTKNPQTGVRYYFTETIAYTEEFLLLEDLKRTHKEEMNIYLLFMFKIFKRTTKKFNTVLPFLYTYSVCGDISKESMLFAKAKMGYYDGELDNFIKLLNEDNLYNIVDDLDYLLAMLLCFYLLYSYKNTKDIGVIRDLRENLNNIMYFNDFYNRIGLKTLNIKELVPFIRHYIEENVLPIIDALEEGYRLDF